ncbi:MAG: hypothetical protein GF311_16175 [Candidatus Lokiarchaeota archaeon]|nr:hypothetical protein [Candidatus Lokiarchaeota archaeon]
MCISLILYQFALEIGMVVFLERMLIGVAIVFLLVSVYTFGRMRPIRYVGGIYIKIILLVAIVLYIIVFSVMFTIEGVDLSRLLAILSYANCICCSRVHMGY